MGLDMYLDCKRYVSVLPNVPEASEPAVYRQIVDAAGLNSIEVPANEIRSVDISVRVAYWRKANQIHKWFVTNVQDGKDDCGIYELGANDLQKLMELCEMLLGKKDNEEAAKKLPPQSGFFFGGTEIDEWYWKDIEYTANRLQQVLQHTPKGCYFTYHSSW